MNRFLMHVCKFLICFGFYPNLSRNFFILQKIIEIYLNTLEQQQKNILIGNYVRALFESCLISPNPKFGFRLFGMKYQAIFIGHVLHRTEQKKSTLWSKRSNQTNLMKKSAVVSPSVRMHLKRLFFLFDGRLFFYLI